MKRSKSALWLIVGASALWTNAGIAQQAPAPTELPPLQRAPAQQAPAQRAPAQPAPVERAPVQQAPAQQGPAQQARPTAPQAPAATAPAGQAAADAVELEGTALQTRELPQQGQMEMETLVPVSGGLTADQVAARTLTTSATIRERQAELEVVEARIRQTTLQFFPRLTLSASYTRLSPVSSGLGGGALVGAANAGQLSVGPCPTGAGQCVLDAGGQPVGAASFAIEQLEDNYGFAATLTIPLSDYILRLSHAIAASKASRRAAQILVAAERLNARTDARILFYNWLSALGQVEVAEKSVERTRARLKDAQAAYQLGAISKADLLRLEALVANTELLVKEAQTLGDLRREQLAIVMGDRNPPTYVVGEDLSRERPPASALALPRLVQEAWTRRLEVRALGEQREAVHANAKAVRSGQWPRLEAFGEASYANPNQRYFPPQREWNATWALGARLTWTVGDAFLNRAAADELSAQAKGIEAKTAGLRDAIRQEVTAAYLDYAKSETAIETSQRALEASREAYRVASDLYQVGRATTTELIEAESDLFSARIAALNAHIQRAVSAVRLDHAAGRDISPESF